MTWHLSYWPLGIEGGQRSDGHWHPFRGEERRGGREREGEEKEVRDEDKHIN
jgi:hypothetical protein